MSIGTQNLYKSFTYSQPDTYRFSHDSVFMARTVFEVVREETLCANTVLDLCSGCGIVGLDFAFHTYQETQIKIQDLDFVEVQNVYAPHLEKNLETFRSLTDSHLQSTSYFENYEILTALPAFKCKYDLILSNPPYFRVGQGKLSPSEFKNRCRFYIDSGFSELLASIEYSLKPGASAFVLVQSLHDHNIDIKSELQNYPALEVIPRGKVRATDLFQLRKTE